MAFLVPAIWLTLGFLLAAPPEAQESQNLPGIQQEHIIQADTLRLHQARAAAARQDPRAVLPELLAQASTLRLAALRAQRLPQLSFRGEATVQNEVPQIPINLPGQTAPGPPHEQFRTQVETLWLLYDGGQTTRRAAAERARLAEDLAGVEVTLYALREATTAVYFNVLHADSRVQSFELAEENLSARLRIVREQAEAGTTLAANAAALEAELIRLRQQVAEAEAGHSAALSILAQLTGLPITSAAQVTVPDLSSEVARALIALDATAGGPFIEGRLIERPEVRHFERRADRAEAEARARESQMRPALSLFGQAGVGRPTPFNFFSDDVAEYGLAGIRLHWSVLDWGRARREADALRLQARRAEIEAEAFARQVVRGIEEERATLSRLDTAIVEDRRAVLLREEVLRVAARQFDEGVLLPDIYTDRLTDLAQARLALERHRIERAQAQARLLSALGRYPE